MTRHISGLSSASALSSKGNSTSTLVPGLIATPARSPREWMYLISFAGDVFSDDVDDGDVAAVDPIAAS